MRSLFINPVLNKEIKLRFRSFKSFLGIFFYLFVLGGIAFAFILINTVFSYNTSAIFRPEQSREMFMVLSVVQMALIIFMTPGLTSGTISGERERQTLNILLTTPQSSTSIIMSKLLSSIAYLLLMIIASLPLYSIVFLFGGVSPGLLASTFGLFFVTMLAIGSMGLLFSTLLRKTIVATIITYGITLFITAGTAFLTIIGMQFTYFQGLSQTYIFPYITALFNPFIVLLSTLEGGLAAEVYRASGIEFSLIASYVIMFIVLSILCLYISIRRLRPKLRISKRSAKG